MFELHTKDNEINGQNPTCQDNAGRSGRQYMRDVNITQFSVTNAQSMAIRRRVDTI
jgi:hypothetical protein